MGIFPKKSIITSVDSGFTLSYRLILNIIAPAPTINNNTNIINPGEIHVELGNINMNNNNTITNEILSGEAK